MHAGVDEPHSAFSAWSSSPPSPSSPASSSSTDSPQDLVVYPLSRPNSQTSLALPDAYQPRPVGPSPVHLHLSSTPLVESFFPNFIFQSADGHSPPPALPSIPPSTPLPASLLALFDADRTSPAPSPPPSTAASATRSDRMPSFPFLRRSASVTDIPVIPPTTGGGTVRSGPFARSRKFYNNPTASASTNDLPLLLPSPLRPPSPHPPPPPPTRPVQSTTARTGAGGAIGPKAGARFLASKEAKRARRKAELLGNGMEYSETGDDDGAREGEEREEEFSIREQVRVRTDGGLSTVTGSEGTARAKGTLEVGIQPTQNSSSEGRTRTTSHSNSNSTSTRQGVRRVPVPSFNGGGGDPDENSFSRSTRRTHRQEGSLHELTRRASQEERELDEQASRRRQASLSKASGAGLASPFATPPQAQPQTAQPATPKRRPPPVAGLNKAPLSEVDEHGRSVPNLLSSRQRSSSADSRGSVTKDSVLSQLGEAIRRERKKADMYEREVEQSVVELAEIGHNLDVLQEKFFTILEQQEQVMQNLKGEIEEVKSELTVVDDLDEAAAAEYLSLLTFPSFDELKARTTPVGAFNPEALTSSASPPVTPAAVGEKSKFSALALKRGLGLKRRVDTHLAAYDTVASNIAVPKPPLPTGFHASTSATVPPLNNGGALPILPRKLSKVRPPILADPAQLQPIQTKPAPPAPAPILPFLFPTASSPSEAKPRPPLQPAKSKKRPPPISGMRVIGGAFGAASESEDEHGGVNGRADSGGSRSRTRKRSKSLTRALGGTMRILFPSNAPKHSQKPSFEQVPLGAPQETWVPSNNPSSSALNYKAA